MSLLATYMYDQRAPLHTLLSYYPPLKEKKRFRTKWDFPNRYFIMFGENIADSRPEKSRR